MGRETTEEEKGHKCVGSREKNMFKNRKMGVFNYPVPLQLQGMRTSCCLFLCFANRNAMIYFSVSRVNTRTVPTWR